MPGFPRQLDSPAPHPSSRSPRANLHPDVRKLLSVQRVDQEIARIRRKLDSLPAEETRRRRSLDALIERHDSARAALTDSEVGARTIDTGIRQSDDEIRKLQERLNTVRNNAEYQATLFQIESVRKERGRLEEEGLALIERIDELKQTVEAAAASRDTEAAVFAEFVAEAAKTRTQLEKELARVREGRAAVLSDLTPELIGKYERLFDARDSLAVCAVEGVTCTGCYTSIPPNLQVKIQAGSAVVYCDSCQRILYLPE